MLCRDMAVHELYVQGMLDLVQGLDPASRRNLWDVVKAAKLNRGIILTTHSMEEAEVSTCPSGLSIASLSSATTGPYHHCKQAPCSLVHVCRHCRVQLTGHAVQHLEHTD